ncbi:MAG: hypothetical protein ABIW38_09035 [Ferruginibacter sp.]
MKNLLILVCLLISESSFAQKPYRHSPLYQRGLYLSFNPHSIFEPQQGAVGIGAGYRINKRWEVWNELNYLYKGFLQDPNEFKNLQGIRNITSLKYFYNNKHGFFVGTEFRYKHYSFDDKNTFINSQLNDTLRNIPYKSSHTLLGGGVFWGKRFKVTANGKFELEGNVGLGVKQRYIKRKQVPAGYEKINYYVKDRIFLLPDFDEEQSLPYFPAIVRFIYHL